MKVTATITVDVELDVQADTQLAANALALAALKERLVLSVDAGVSLTDSGKPEVEITSKPQLSLASNRKLGLELARRLNDGRWWVNEDGVLVRDVYDVYDAERGLDGDEEASDVDLERLGVASVRLEAHPEGADRGGYVHVAYGPAGEWCRYDNGTWCR